MPEKSHDARDEVAQSSSPARDEQVYGYGSPPGDEIGLFDLWDALVRRRWLIVAVAGAVILAALAYGLTRPDIYRYHTALRIGHTVTENAEGGLEERPIASAETVMAELRASIVPDALRQVLELSEAEVAAGAGAPDVRIDSPEGSGIINLSIEGPTANEESYREILRVAAARVIRDHAGTLEIEQSRVSRRLAQLERERARVRDELDNVETRIERLSAAEEPGRGATALRIDALHRRAEDLETQALELEAERDRLMAARSVLSERSGVFGKGLDADIIARQRAASRAIASLQVGVSPSRALTVPERSLQQVGTSGVVILVLGIVLGSMLGVFAAFVAEFLAAARRRREP